jgi:hypothetical protein
MVVKVMNNKEVVEKLIAYYRQQDVELIYRILANFQIDFNRLDNMDQLGEEEKCTLLTRIKLNSSVLRKFIREGDNGNPLILTNIEDIK